MPTIQSLQKEIDSLKKENSTIKKRLSSLEGKGSSSTSKGSSQESSSSNTTGTVLIIIGVLLSLTLIGAIIGIPLIIWGSSLSSKDTKKSVTKSKTTKTKKEVKRVEKKPAKTSFEEDVGMKWFSRIGIAALVIGVGFFIKYAIDSGWINHLSRIIMGVVFGIALIIFGEIVSKKKKYESWARTLVGGGIAITYFVVYAAYHFPDYRAAIGISQTLDIILLSVIVLSAILLSLRDNSQIIAAESFLLGHITSFLSSSFGFMTVVYGLLLTVGLVFVVSYKKWPVIGLFGVAASYVSYLLWDTVSFAHSSFILISYFLAFSIQSFFLLKDKKSSEQNIIITLLNSAAFFLIYYFEVEQSFSEYTGLLALGLSLFYFVGYMVFDKEKNFSTTYLYLALLYITIAIPIQLNEQWVTIIWALETVVLTLLFLRLKNSTLKVSSFILGSVTLLKTIVYDINFLDGLDVNNLLRSTRLFSFLVTIVCFYVVYKLLKNSRQLSKDELAIPFLYSWAAAGLFVLILFLELYDDYSVWISIILSVVSVVALMCSKLEKQSVYQSLIISGILFVKVLFFDSWELQEFTSSNFYGSTRLISFGVAALSFYSMGGYLENNKRKLSKSDFGIIPFYSYAGTLLAFVLIALEMEEFWISVGWSILALIIMVIGFSARKKNLRFQGMLIFAITIFKVFIYDTRSLDTIYRTISYTVLGVILLLVSFLYTKYKEKLKEIL